MFQRRETDVSDHRGTHNDLHSEQGALPGEHPGRAKNPVIKVRDIAWLEFEKPDLDKAETFARAFGFSTVSRTPDALQLRGSLAGPPCVIIRRAPRSRFVAAAFHAADSGDLLRLAEVHDAEVKKLPDSIGGLVVDLTEPSGGGVRVVADVNVLPEMDSQDAHIFNFGGDVSRVNATQRPPREPARVERLGHVVLQTTKYRESLDWYLDNLGLIVSDF
jgi:catechol 2,3-dioxygenase-like lactoylglutathione lyase family enzyme